MMIVAIEAIDAGAEVRINYEEGHDSYWNGDAPRTTDRWRHVRLPVPPPTVPMRLPRKSDP